MTERPGNDDLLDRLRAALAPRAEILDAYLFGSLARDECATHSDIDVAVYVAEDGVVEAPSVFGYRADLSAELMRTLGTDAVDIVLLNRAPPLLYHRVLRDGVRVLARDPAATTTREGRALSRYFDYLPQLAKIAALSKQRSERGEFGR